MNNKDIWLDLELRKDIDDYITLIFALEQNYNVKEISIDNPSLNELQLLLITLKELKKEHINIIITGIITEYSLEEDIHISLFNKIKNFKNSNKIEISDYKNLFFIKDYLKNNEQKNKIIFCGGSLKTLSLIFEQKNIENKNIECYIQGGYASENIVGIENTLKKFKKREKVPSWNLNIDLESTDKVLKNNKMNIKFISKNICHNSWIGLEDLNNNKTYFNDILKSYFLLNDNNKKCMHDLLAFLTIKNKDIVEFKKIDLNRTNDENPKWFSILNNKSNKSISISLNLEMYKSIVRMYKSNNFVQDFKFKYFLNFYFII